MVRLFTAGNDCAGLGGPCAADGQVGLVILKDLPATIGITARNASWGPLVR